MGALSGGAIRPPPKCVCGSGGDRAAAGGRQGEAEQPALAGEVGAAAVWEQARDGRAGDVEAAGEGAEGREHEAVGARDEAGAGDGTGAGGDAGFRVVVADEFGAFAGSGLVAEGEAAEVPAGG